MSNKNINMLSKLRIINSKKLLLITLPILIVGFSIGSYWILTNMNKNKNNNDNLIPDVEEPEIDENDIFPEIDSKDFYNLIEFENGLPFIGDNMLAAIIKDIVTRLGSVEGNLTFYIIENSRTEKIIYFKWIYEEKELKKTYIISINSL
ncbi:MAG: MHO_1590 family protein [Metamycoplasmataceae bacterium]